MLPSSSWRISDSIFESMEPLTTSNVSPASKDSPSISRGIHRNQM